MQLHVGHILATYADLCANKNTKKIEPARLFAHVASNLPRHADQKSVGRSIYASEFSFSTLSYTEPLTGHLQSIFQTYPRAMPFGLMLHMEIVITFADLQQRRKIGLDKQLILDSSILTFSCLNRGEYIESDR